MMTKRITVEAFTEAVNYAVIGLPGRRFPGVVVQGDSLYRLYTLSKRIAEDAEEGAFDERHELCGLLGDVVRWYESVLAKEQIDLPYKKE